MVEIGKESYSKSEILNLSVENNRDLPQSIRVEGKFLGATEWKGMLKKTEETGKEHGVIVSLAKNKLLTSTIFTGVNEDPDPNTGKITHSITPPFLPHGLRSLFPSIKDIVAVHTHPETENTKHFSTTTFSSTDIDAYAYGSYHAAVMVDKGGAHLLTGKSPYFDPDTIRSREIFSDAHKKARDNTQSIKEVRAEIAKSLSRFGIQYYFTPHTDILPDGYINFTNIKSTPYG